MTDILKQYTSFLHNKVILAPETGFQVNENEVSEVLLPHQRDAVIWAIKGGRRALFESFGLGKTLQQLEICRIITKKEGGRALIVCPLGVKQEFTRDAKNLLGINVVYIRTNDELVEHYNDTNIFITNYERVRDGDINPNSFKVTSLDEASVLRGYGTKTFQTFLEKFKGVEYKFVCTATPSPNKYKELIHYAGYLEVMDTGQALTRFFKRDSTKANNLTIYPHKEKEFWLWMSTWALFITKPSDLGYDDTGYDLPEMKIIYHAVSVDHSTAVVDQDGQKKAFRDSALGLKEASKEKRDSMPARIAKMKEIINDNADDNFLIWHDLESERHEVMKTLKGYDIAEVYGNQSIEKREQTIIDFSEGRIQYLATKPVISGQGCNFQYHCNKAIFLGVGYKFNDFIQAVHRIYRFQQIHEVEIHIIYAESEGEILKTLQKKWKQHNYLVEQMTALIKENGLSVTNIEQKLTRSIGVERRVEKGKLWEAAHNDCVLETAGMESNSVGLVHTSIPFSNHYEYTPSYNDFGHTKNDDHFFEQMDFLTPELHRVLMPGRLAVVHVKDRILFGNTTGKGMPTVNPFHMATTYHFLKHGFAYMGMITIETDVVRENNQTYRLGWTECCKDHTKMGVGSPEYLLLFRKLPSDTSKAYADLPVTRDKKEYSRGRWQIDARAKWNSSGNRFLNHDEIKQLPIDKINRYFSEYFYSRIYNFKQHVEIAEEMEKFNKLPATFETLKIPARTQWVWSDVTRMQTLNGEQSKRNLENHICPLQFDIVDRVIEEYSNPGELVYDPFGGLMTVPYRAVLLGRLGKGSELNPTSFRDGLQYLRAAELDKTSPSLFDVMEMNPKVETV